MCEHSAPRDGGAGGLVTGWRQPLAGYEACLRGLRGTGSLDDLMSCYGDDPETAASLSPPSVPDSARREIEMAASWYAITGTHPAPTSWASSDTLERLYGDIRRGEAARAELNRRGEQA